MPIYAYRCTHCGHAQDVLQKMSDPVLTVCPACGQPTYVKQVTAAGFQLKGSGWYVTDFRDGKSAKPKDAGADAGKDGAAAAAADGKAGAAAPAGDAGKGNDKSDGPSGEKKSSDGTSGDARPAKESAAAAATPAAAPAAKPASAPATPPAASGKSGS